MPPGPQKSGVSRRAPGATRETASHFASSLAALIAALLLCGNHMELLPHRIANWSHLLGGGLTMAKSPSLMLKSSQAVGALVS